MDFVVLHPGVVRTDLGARTDLFGKVLAAVKRAFFESPEDCAERLARILARPRWSPPGEARWLLEETEKPWPRSAEDAATREAVRATTAELLVR